MKKNVTMNVLVTAILVSSVAVFASCDAPTSKVGGAGNNKTNGNMSVRDVYAMSAVSGVSYLSDGEKASTGAVGAVIGEMAVMASAGARPDNITDSDVAGMENCIATFQSILLGGGFEQTVQENNSADPRFSEYTWEMNIGLGTLANYTMYFNELEKKVEYEMDDGEEEIEERTSLEGVIVYGEELFVVSGVKEVETEGREVETSMEFRTYKNVGVAEIQADENNFVIVSQSVENDEVEYAYSFYQNGRKVQELELEYEENARGVELSFQIKDIRDGKVSETEYELRKKGEGFIIEFEKNEKEDKISVQKEGEGYRFVYSNGYEEVIE